MTITISRDTTVARFSPAMLGKASQAGDELAAIDRIGTVVSLSRDQALFFEGDRAEYCYKVLTGAVRSLRLLADGRRHVGDFHLPGDFIALEAEDVYRFTVEAVNDAAVMRYSRSAIDRLIQQHPGLGRRLLGLVCGGLSAAQSQMLLLGRKNATERLASFLLNMSERSGDAQHITLPMTRSDIADYLGLTIETVSRVFSQLRSQGVIQLKASSEVLVKSRDALEDLAEAA